MKQGNLNIRCTEDYAVLYWDKPAAAQGAEYTVSLNGEGHWPHRPPPFYDRGAELRQCLPRGRGQRQLLIGSATLQFGREKRRVDITAAPYFCKGRRPYPEHRRFTAGHQRLRRGRYSVRAGGRFPDRRTTAAQRSGNLSGQGARSCRAQRTFTTIRPHPQPIGAPRCAATQKPFERRRHEPQDRPELPQYHHPRQGHDLRRRAGAGPQDH